MKSTLFTLISIFLFVPKVKILSITPKLRKRTISGCLFFDFILRVEIKFDLHRGWELDF